MSIESTGDQSETHRSRLTDPLYGVWCSMKRRCDTPSGSSWHRYGGRGIRVCDEWLYDYTVFRSWALDSNYQPGLVLDRIDNDGNYSPDNCRFTTFVISAENRANACLITAWGETKNVSAWSRDPRCAVQQATIRQRIKKGWNPETAISAPPNTQTRPPRPKAEYCINGHPQNSETTRINSRNERVCLICARERNRKYKQRKRETNQT